MRSFIPPFVLLLFFVACKKDQTAPPPNPSPNAGDTTLTNPGQGNGTFAITGIAPSTGLPNTVVTISGSNFGNTASGMTVRFNGVAATIQSVKPTEIKVLVPVTTTGNVMVSIGDKYAAGPVFTYLYPELSAPYANGDVTLHNQAEVDAFVTLNKGKQVQINGSLFIGASNLVSNQTNDITSLAGLSLIQSVTGQVFFYQINLPEATFLNTLTAAGSIYIYSCAFTSLGFNGLGAFSGSITLSDLPKLTSVAISLQPTMANITLSLCPLLTDVSFLNTVVSANILSLGGLGVTTIAMDQLRSVRNGVSVSSHAKLTSLSLPSLATIGDPTLGGGVTITYCPLLATIDCHALTTLRGKLTLRSLNIRDMTGFRGLTSIGALLLDGNPALADLHGLEQLTSFTMAGVNTSTIGGNSPISRANGVYISNNATLTSLNGLQQVSTIPIAYISDNPLLNDLCPFKNSVNALSKLPDYTYTYTNQIDQHRPGSIAALTLLKNGKYATTADAMATVKLCQ